MPHDAQFLAAAALLDVRGRPDLADAVMAYVRPAPTVEPAECHCSHQRSCHVGHAHRGLLPDAPLPPGVVPIEMED